MPSSSGLKDTHTYQIKLRKGEVRILLTEEGRICAEGQKMIYQSSLGRPININKILKLHDIECGDKVRYGVRIVEFHATCFQGHPYHSSH